MRIINYYYQLIISNNYQSDKFSTDVASYSYFVTYSKTSQLNTAILSPIQKLVN